MHRDMQLITKKQSRLLILNSPKLEINIKMVLECTLEQEYINVYEHVCLNMKFKNTIPVKRNFDSDQDVT